MLIGFSVSNYKSFYGSQSISMLASKVTRHREHVMQSEGRKILKSALIFGANAGGKSNLIHAVFFSKEVILKGTERINLEKKHFRILNETYYQPGVFEYRILTKGKEYSYGLAISYDKGEILAEWLIRIEENGKETYLYNREVDENGRSRVSTEIIQGQAEEEMRMKVYLEDFDKNISDAFRKKTILSDVADRGNGKEGIFAEITNVHRWFRRLIILFPHTKYSGLGELTSDEEAKELFSDIIAYFDTGIDSVEGQQQEMDFDKVLEKLPRERAEKIKVDISNKVREHPIQMNINQKMYVLRRDEKGNIIYSKMLQNHGNLEDLFEYEDESDGTKRLFDLIPLFYESGDDSVILIDEIDRSLHTMATRRFLELFYEFVEEDKCQLIATTHDINLLDLDLLRQDEIWFVERKPDHSSQVYSLNKFRARFDKKVDKDYLLGRYGAIPVFQDEYLEGEETYEE
ncbi:MAG: ATP-binding protein [Lachnospiraceae bacterium]|nr:ATP-binding protein [Lachnospiraceae bacterium]